MKDIQFDLQNLMFIFMPSYWLMNDPYSPAWNKKLNELMANHKFTNYNGHTADLGDHQIWIANHPYASFEDFGHVFDRRKKVRASRLTIYKAMEKLKKDLNGEPL